MITLITNGAPTNEYGIKSLVAYLQSNDIPVTAIYMSYCDSLHKKLQKQILDIAQGSKLVGFSLMTNHVPLFMPVIRDIRHKLKIPVVTGGIHPTALPKESLEFSDYVCVGEGEEPLKQLYLAVQEKSSCTNIPNIGYKKQNGEKIINAASYFVNNLDELPYPDYQFQTSYYYNQFEIVKITPEIRSNCLDSFYFYSQRGCKLACTYCSNSIYAQLARRSQAKWYRMASAERIIQELKTHLHHFPQVKTLTFNDDDFIARDVDELKKITCFVKNELKLPFSMNAVPTFTTQEKIKLLVDNGLKNLAFGVQTGSSRVLKQVYKRPVTREHVLQAATVVAKYQKYGLTTDYGFILDNPYEKQDEWLETLNLIRALPKPRTISLYSLQFFPGTVLTTQAIKDTIIDNSQPIDFKKDYRSDIKYSFKNTMVFLYSYFNIPHWLHSILFSNFIMYSKAGTLIRFIIAYPLGYFIRTNKRVAAANRETLFIKKIFKKIRVIKITKYKISQSLSKVSWRKNRVA